VKELKDIKKITLHMIGHAHIDPVWLWRWSEGAEEIRATFRSALKRMKETPQFTFIQSSASFYKWIKEVDPQMFAEIRKRVKEGRWELVGGWWVEPDCNIPSGESFVRQSLYSQQFFEKEFGKKATIGFNPDSFGHAGTLPQILKKSGMKAYIFSRPAPDIEMHYPGTTFWWRAKDGSKVLASCIPFSYGSGENLREKMMSVAKWRFKLKGQRELLCFYGVGDHGGGPTKKNIEEIIRAMKDPKMPNVRFSKLEDYIKAFLNSYQEDEIPVIEGDLQHHSRGCYSAHSEVKFLNREIEHTLMTAERLSTIGSLLFGQVYPKEELNLAWENLLFNQFHDVLAGTCIKEAYEEVRDRYGLSRYIGSNVVNKAIQRIAKKIDTSRSGRGADPAYRYVLVVNPLPWEVEAPIHVTSGVRRGLGEKIKFLNEKGEEVLSQNVLSGEVGNYEHLFIAKVPALGYRCYSATDRRDILVPQHPASDRRDIPVPHHLLVSTDKIENDFWIIELDPSFGYIRRLFDKENKVEVLNKGGVLSVMVDNSDTWSHGVKGYRIEEGQFSNPERKVYEKGEVRATLQTTTFFASSKIEQFISLYRDLRRIDYTLWVNWQERYKTLKLIFATNIEEGKAYCEIPYGSIERPLKGEEEPAQQWIDLSGKVSRVVHSPQSTVDSKGDRSAFRHECRSVFRCEDKSKSSRRITYGLAIINNGKYGFDVTKGTLRLTVLRSPAYAHHDDARYSSSLPYPIIDQGIQTIRYLLIPHLKGWEEAGIPRKAWEFNSPLITHQESSHQGELPLSLSIMRVEPENVIVSVLKVAEISDALIVRGYETDGRDCIMKLTFPYWSKSFEFKLGAYEIKTIRIEREKRWKAKEVNLLEEDGYKNF